MPRTLPRRQFLAGALLAPLLGHAPDAHSDGDLKIGGTGVGLGPLQRIANGVDAHALRFVPNLGSGGGLKAVAAGAIDIAVSARQLGDKERAAGLFEHELFRTPIVWAVHDDVPLRRLALNELEDLYAARTPQWADGRPVRLVMRPQSDSDTHFLHAISPSMSAAVALAQARPGVRVATTDTDATEAIERISGSLGVTTLGLMLAERRRVHVLEIDRVEPGLETMLAGRYPYVKRVFIVTRGTPSGKVADMVARLMSPSAAKLLTTVGCQSATPA